MLKILVPLLFLVVVNGRRVQVPFLGYYFKSPAIDYTRIEINASIGTPGQNLRVEIAKGGFDYEIDLYLLDLKTFGYGFDPTKSSTFVALKNMTTSDGHNLNATDTVNLGGSILKAKPIQVVYDTKTNYLIEGRMGVDRHNADDPDDPCLNRDKCTSFVESVLQGFDEKVLVFAFDKIQNYPTNNFTGQLVFGEKPKDLCGGVWGVLPELPLNVTYTQWTFAIDGISVGKYAWEKPVGRASIDLNNSGFYIPQNIFNGLLKTIGGTEHYFPCNATANVVFNLGGVEVSVGPEIYTQKRDDGTCGLNGFVVWKPEYQIPFSGLSNYCLLYDYKDFGLKIAKRVKA